jgi:hypothetical protein
LVTNLPPFVQILWATSIAVQLALCGILIYFRHFRKLPFFTAYVCLNIAQSLFLYPIYLHYGAYSHTAKLAGWWSEAITLLARIFATLEILHVVLIAYRGIWGLAWRLLATTSVVVFVCVVAASWGDAERALMRADRGYHLIFAAALISCLALIRHYLIRVGKVYKVLLVGFCFYSCVKILLNTVLYDSLYQQRSQYTTIWQVLVISPYLIVLLFWGAALLRPLPKMQEQQAVLPTSLYGRISPEINLQLQAINKKLMNFWKIEELQQ